jgi:hypothetical protein
MNQTLRLATIVATLLAGQSVMAQQVVNEIEPNDTRATAHGINPLQGVTVNGTIGASQDIDHYRVDYIPGGECLVARLTPNPYGDYNVRIVDKDGRTVATARRPGGIGQFETASICFKPAPLYVVVTYSAGDIGAYTLQVSH